VHPGGPGTLAVGISASGGTEETVAAVRRHAERGSTTVALTNVERSPLEAVADRTVAMRAGPEDGGVACRSFQHTLALLLDLEARLRGDPHAAAVVRRAADATEDLLARRDAWLPPARDLLTATGQAFLIAPAERIASAEQGALMLREGPRLMADACETGDWLHVDVYLTKPLDYRALLFAGSRFDTAVMTWVAERHSTVVAVGRDVPGAAAQVRYPSDDDPDVATLTEVLVAELVAAAVWAERDG
jgi:fructoselysine-6-P-deglycase FrlB-like protein